MKVTSSPFRLMLGLLLLVVVGESDLIAQQPDLKSSMPVKFDEYGRVGGCDHSARLDNFAITLQNTPDLNAYVVSYGPEGDEQSTGRVGERIKDYLVNSRGIDGERISTAYGGRNDDLKSFRIQLWLIPPGVVPPEPTKYENALETFTGMFDEYHAWDGVNWGEFEEGSGPSVGKTTEVSFLQMLTKRRSTTAYIVAFNGSDAAPGAWRRVATAVVEDFQKRGVESTRLRIVYGGTTKETKVQLWIVPTAAQPPVNGSAEEPLPKKTVLLGSFVDLQLAETRSERWALNSLLEVLQQDESLRAAIIVRLESDIAEEADEKIEAAIVTIASESDFEPEEPDDSAARKDALLKLVEKWKSELTTTYKIKADRVVVLFSSTPKHSQNSLETWIVPAGQPLPDPEGQVEEEAEEKTDDVPGS